MHAGTRPDGVVGCSCLLACLHGLREADANSFAARGQAVGRGCLNAAVRGHGPGTMRKLVATSKH